MDTPTPDAEAVAAYLAQTEATLETYINETQHTYLDVYLGRMHALHAIGAPPADVIRQCWLAVRCYADNGDVYLAKWPPHRVRSRRLLPLELALIAGDEAVHAKMAATMVFDVMVLLAGQEPKELTAELEELTNFFTKKAVADAGDLAGALAIIYACALGAILEEQPERLKMSVATADLVVEQSWIMLRNPSPGLARLLAAHKALAAALRRDLEGFVAALSEHGRLHAMTYAAAAAEDEDARKLGNGSLDTTALALVEVADAVGLEIGPALAAAADVPTLETPRRYVTALLAAPPS